MIFNFLRLHLPIKKTKKKGEWNVFKLSFQCECGIGRKSEGAISKLLFTTIIGSKKSCLQALSSKMNASVRSCLKHWLIKPQMCNDAAKLIGKYGLNIRRKLINTTSWPFVAIVSFFIRLLFFHLSYSFFAFKAAFTHKLENLWDLSKAK